MLSSTSDEICKMFPLTFLGLLANLCLPFASPDVLFLMQIYHDFHFVVARFGLGAVTGTNRSADLHVRLEIRLSKAALPRAAPRCAQHRITLITGNSENLFSLLQKIQKYIFSRKKELRVSLWQCTDFSGLSGKKLGLLPPAPIVFMHKWSRERVDITSNWGNNSLLLKGPVPFSYMYIPHFSCITSGVGATTGPVSSVTWSGRKLSH